jgi:cytochrome c
MKPAFAAAVLTLAAASAHAAPLPRPGSFAICGVCHKTDAGAAPGIGPNLFGVGTRVSGTGAGYAYSPAMKAAKVKWSKAELIGFISDPQKRVPGTKMAFAGQKDPAQAAAIADYLLSLK